MREIRAYMFARSLAGHDKGKLYVVLRREGDYLYLTDGGKIIGHLLGKSEKATTTKAAKASGEKSVLMVHVKEITALTGYVRGGCSPIGMKKQYTTFYHNTAAELESITVSAGKIGYQVELSPEALIRLTNGRLADIATEE